MFYRRFEKPKKGSCKKSEIFKKKRLACEKKKVYTK